MRPLQFALGLMLCLTISGPTALAQHGLQNELQIVLYQPPITDPVIDDFRPPAHIGAPGNRGLEYGNLVGQHVYASAEGVVTFAGPVAGRGVITLQHGDGIRTTYTGVGEIWVDVGDFVRKGWTMGAAAGRLHFGARIQDHYLDPQILIDASSSVRRPQLVPSPDNE